MITKEHLEELIKQGATIYSADTSNKTILSFKICKNENDIKLTEKQYAFFKKCFETKAEAEWHAEFGCIERTERLELPTLEEVNQICLSIITFINKDGKECNLVVEVFENRITVNGVGGAYDIWDLTKENYTLACRKCKELFLGENE